MSLAARNLLVVASSLAISVAAAVAALAFWFTYDPAGGLDARVPGNDGTPAEARDASGAVNLAGTFQQFDGVPANLPGAWPRFRGADYDNIVKDGPPLADTWDEQGPPVLWSLELGEGHAAPAVLNGRVYVLDYDEAERKDAVRCFSLDDGREIWRHSYPVVVKRNHGMSRTVPAVSDKLLVTMGPRCHVVCLEPVTGAFKWGVDLQRDYGTKEPLWYSGQCPLIDNGQVILAPCGKDVLMLALDGDTGKPAWQTPNPHGWDMSHSSIVPMEIASVRMYVYCAVGGMLGVAAEGAEAGKVLWELPWNAKVVAPSPVSLEDGRIFMTAGYGEGGMTIRVQEQGGAFTAEVLETHGPKDGLACEQQTPIFHGGRLYTIMPKDAGALRGQFVCYNPDGTQAWASGQSNRFGLGPFVLADGKFYILDDSGLLTMARLSETGYEPLARAQVLHGSDAWGPMAIVGGRMLLRDSKQMVCISIAGRTGG